MWFIRLTCYLIMTVRSPSVMYEASTKPLVDSVQGFHVQLVDFFDVAARGVGDGGGERGIGCELKVQVFGIQVFLSDFGRHATHLACCNGVPACFTSHSLNGTRLGQLRVTMSNLCVEVCEQAGPATHHERSGSGWLQPTRFGFGSARDPIDIFGSSDFHKNLNIRGDGAEHVHIACKGGGANETTATPPP